MIQHMTDPILRAAREERSRLERTIASAKTRIAEIDSFLQMYASLAAQAGVPTPELPEALSGLAPDGGEVIEISRPLTVKETVITKCQQLLEDGRPRHTRDLLDALMVMGVKLRGKNRLLQVSAILSKEDRFVSDRARGWTLRATQAEGPDVGASEPSNSRRTPLLPAVERQPHP